MKSKIKTVCNTLETR